MPMPEIATGLILEKIMFATDFSPCTERAREYAKALAHHYGARVGIAHVRSSFGDDGPVPDVSERSVFSEQRYFQQAGIKVTLAQANGSPVPDELLLLEREFAPNMIVIGTESKSKLDRLLIGSTAEKLIREAQAPVLTVGPNAKKPRHGDVLFKRIILATDCTPASERAAELATALAKGSGRACSLCMFCAEKRREMKRSQPQQMTKKAFAPPCGKE